MCIRPKKEIDSLIDYYTEGDDFSSVSIKFLAYWIQTFRSVCVRATPSYKKHEYVTRVS